MFFNYSIDKERIKKILQEDALYMAKLDLILSNSNVQKKVHCKKVSEITTWKKSRNKNKYLIHEMEMLQNLKNAIDENIKILPKMNNFVNFFFRRRTMINTLIVDPQECSCFLLKSILLTKRFGISIANTYEESYLKIRTGLFDILYIDASNNARENFEFVKEALKDFENLPIVVLCKEEHLKQWENWKITYLIKKPIKVSIVLESAKTCLKKLQDSFSQNIISKDLEFSCSVLKKENNESIECRGTRISRNGILIEASKTNFAEMNRFHWFFKNNNAGRFKTDITTTDGNIIAGTMKIAFMERSSDMKIKLVGMTIDEEDKDLKTNIAKIFTN